MISYNSEPRRLVSTFLAYRNDIDIYTEDDEKDKEFYTVLFKRLLRPELKINDITPLGSKQNVIEQCKLEPKNGRRKIFIIDGDIAMVHGNVPTLPNLYVLNGYCIENFVIDKNSVCQFVYLNCGTKSPKEIEQTLEFEGWLSTYSESLIELFLHFALINKLGGKFTLNNANKYHIKIKNKLSFNRTAVAEDIQKLKSEILNQHNESTYQSEYIALRSKWPNSVGNLLTVVSGKDYLIPILLIKIQEFKASKAIPSLEEVKISLVQSCNLDRLSGLKYAIEFVNSE